MRKALNALYWGGFIAAAFFLAIIAFVILLQIFGRVIGVIVPSANEIAGYSMAASIFLGLADTLRANAHIRVEALIGRTSGSLRRALDLWSYGLSACLIGYLTFHAFAMTWNSFATGESSPGLLAIPIWIPQIGMSVGLALLALVCLESFVDLTLHGNIETKSHATSLGSE